MKKILVTGGAGFIGSHIVDKYIDTGYEVVVVDDLSTGKKEFVNPKAKFYGADLRRKDDISKIISDEKPEVINHQAAQKSVNDSVKNPSKDAEINILGFLNLMEAAKENDIKKVIFASTGGAIYGDTDNIPTSEDELPQPASPYAITKFTSENYLRFYMETASIMPVILRYSNVYGPRQDPYGEAGVVAIFSKLIAQDKPVTVFGNSKQTRDYIFVADIAEANLKALEYQPKDFDSAVMNIGTGIETPLNSIIDLLRDASGKEVQVKNDPPRPGDLLRSAIKNDKASQLLSWHPQVELKEGIEKTYKYFA